MSKLINPYPYRSIVEVNYDCNLKCRTCIVWNKNFKKIRSKRKILNTLQILKIQNQLKKLSFKSITYLGGEPFLRKDLLTLAKEAKKQALYTAVVTNGTLISKETIKNIIKHNCFDTIIFSLDGPEFIHNSVRQSPNAFSKVCSVIKEIQNLKKKNHIKFPRIFIYSTLSKINWQFTEEIFSIAQKLDAQALRFVLASSVDKELINQTNLTFGKEVIKLHSYSSFEDIILPKEILPKLRNTILKLKKKAKKIGLKLNAENILLGKKNSACNYIGKEIIISPYADVYLCPMLPEYTVGNLKKQSLKEIFSSTLFWEKLNYLKDLVLKRKLSICKECCVEKILF